MLTNDAVRLIANLQNENRRLKSKQTIMGSTVKTGSSSIGPLKITPLVAGTGSLSYYTVGTITMTLDPLDDGVTDPIMTFNIVCSTSSISGIDISNNAPQFPAGMGGFGFGFAVTSVSGNAAVAKYCLNHNYQQAEDGTPLYLYIFASGTSLLTYAEATWNNITT